jgi:hypothetical protein
VEYILRCGLDITHRANNRVVVVLTMLSHKGENSGMVCRASSQFEVVTKEAVTAICEFLQKRENMLSVSNMSKVRKRSLLRHPY